MSTDNRHTNWLGIIAVALVCALLGALGGTLAGGAAGFLLGRQSMRSALARAGTSTTPQREFNVQPQPQPQPLVPPDGWDFQWPEQVPGLSGEVYAQVERVVAGSPAEQAGLQAGDRIVAADGEALSLQRDLAQVVATHRVGDQLELTIERGGAQQQITATLGESPDQAGQAYLGITYRLAVDAPSRYPSS